MRCGVQRVGCADLTAKPALGTSLFPLLVEPSHIFKVDIDFKVTKSFINRVAVARHMLILCQHEDTACTDLLEADLGIYRSLFDRFWVEILDSRVSGIKNHIYIYI